MKLYWKVNFGINAPRGRENKEKVNQFKIRSLNKKTFQEFARDLTSFGAFKISQPFDVH
jgi:hypothetical protein